MKSIKLVSYLLEWLLMVVLIPGYSITIIFRWFGLTIPIYDVAKGGGFFSGFTRGAWYYFDYGYQPLFIARFVGFFVDFISLIIFFIGCRYFIKLVRLYRHNEFFSQHVFLLFKKITKVAFWASIYHFVKLPLLSVATTYFHNEPGARVLSIGFSSNDIINMFVVGCFYLLTSVMYHGYQLKQDQDLTV